MLAALDIVERRIGPVTVLALSGRLVADEGDRPFREHITTLVSAGQTSILLDLREVEYIDSGGVGALAAMYMHVYRRGGRLKLLCLSRRVRRVLELARLLTVFEVFDDEEEAVRSFDVAPVTPAPVRRHVRAS